MANFRCQTTSVNKNDTGTSLTDILSFHKSVISLAIAEGNGIRLELEQMWNAPVWFLSSSHVCKRSVYGRNSDSDLGWWVGSPVIITMMPIRHETKEKKKK